MCAERPDSRPINLCVLYDRTANSKRTTQSVLNDVTANLRDNMC
jgi:hypothetical protein